MGSRVQQLIADVPNGSRTLMAFAAFVFLTLSLSALMALALSLKAFLGA